MSVHYTEFLERQSEKDQKTIKALYGTLDSIARWGEQNGAYWCRETARKTLNKVEEKI